MVHSASPCLLPCPDPWSRQCPMGISASIARFGVLAGAAVMPNGIISTATSTINRQSRRMGHDFIELTMRFIVALAAIRTSTYRQPSQTRIPQPQGVADHRHRAERHGCPGDDWAQQQTEPWIEHASGERNACCIEN